MKRLTLEKREGLGFIHLDDAKANAIQDEFLTQLDTTLDACERDPDLSAVVLAGRDGFFSAGLDLKLLPTLNEADFKKTLEHLCATTTRLFTFPKPVVAAITGHAIAGGAVLALGADIRVAAEGTYRIGLSEVAIGVPLPSFIVEIARETVPAAAIIPVCLHGTLVPPEEALRMGIVQEVGPLEQVREKAAAQARRLGQLKPSAYQSTKRRIRMAAAERGRAAFSTEIDEFMRAFRTIQSGR
ncbi:MAG: enoyl-CoA hydratase/isomerase family protein [Deltaproteobacteria bacterium]|nr:enoyl-CoA hydratase/isomerase family protein [Deltaproteobacteria bacterium]